MTLRFRNATLCEYVGQEANGKHMLAGIYSGNVTVPAFPASLHFAVYVEFEAEEPGDYRIETQLQLGDDATIRGLVNATGVVPEVSGVFTFAGLNADLGGSTFVELRAIVNDGAPQVLFRKEITQQS